MVVRVSAPRALTDAEKETGWGHAASLRRAAIIFGAVAAMSSALSYGSGSVRGVKKRLIAAGSGARAFVEDPALLDAATWAAVVCSLALPLPFRLAEELAAASA